MPKNVKELGFTMVRYERGGYLKQHKDAKDRVDHFVLGMSIGGPCNLDFVQDSDAMKATLPLASKSVFVTEEKAHDFCTHGISDVKDTRYSVLFYVPSAEDSSERFDIEAKKFVQPKITHHHCCCCSGENAFSIFQLIKILSTFSNGSTHTLSSNDDPKLFFFTPPSFGDDIGR